MNPTITLEEIYAPVESGLTRVPDTILGLLSDTNLLSQEVIRHFFSSQGKLLRPALTLLGASIKDSTTVEADSLRALAASFEIFHAATLIHDDIIDSAHLRRGIPSVNVKFGPDVAVLVGDYLHDKAIGTIYENGKPGVFPLFLETAGRVCDGEIQELAETRNLDLSEAVYFEIIEKKTACLLACAVKAGGLMAGATQEEAGALYRFGNCFGMAFQIVDDCLDFSGEEKEFGKTLGTDAAEGVLTLPLIRLLAGAGAAEKKTIIELFQSAGEDEKFEALLAMIRRKGTLEEALERAREFSAQACRELEIFPASPGKRSLESLADYVLERTK